MAISIGKLVREVELSNALSSMRGNWKVKWIVGGVSHHIPVKHAAFLSRCSSYEGKVHNNRVYFIRQIDNRRSNAFDHTFRDDRPVLQFNPITSKTIDLWDQHFANRKVAVP